MTDSRGCLVDEEGFDFLKVSVLRDIKVQHRSLRLVHASSLVFCIYPSGNLIAFMHRDYLKSYPRAKYLEAEKPWNERYDIAFPCSLQNEIDQVDAIALVNSGCRILIEGNYLLIFQLITCFICDISSNSFYLFHVFNHY